MFRSGFLILSGNALTSLLLLARNLIVARFISIEDYGIAATFAVSMAIVEMMSALGLQQQIVQAKEGDDLHFQASLQGFQILRGTISSLALYILSGPIALFLNIPQVTWAYQLLSIVPFLNALIHFDIYRLTRRMVFGPMIITSLLPVFVSVSVIWPLNDLYGDYRVLLYALIAQALLTVITSHFVAERPYRLAFDKAIIFQSMRFGWPILLNGVLLFVSFNFDKLIIAKTFGIVQLAIFSMGSTLTLTPILVLEKSIQSIFLPKLSKLTNNNSVFQNISIVAFQAHIASGILLVLCTIYFAPLFVDIFLGDEYAPLVPLLTLMAIMHAIHAFKNGNSPSSIAMFQTSNSFYCSLPKLASLPITVWFAVNAGSIELIIWISIFAEFVGFVITLFLSSQRLGLPLRPLLLPVILSFFSMMFAWQSSAIASLVALGLGISAIWAMHTLRNFLKEHL